MEVNESNISSNCYVCLAENSEYGIDECSFPCFGDEILMATAFYSFSELKEVADSILLCKSCTETLASAYIFLVEVRRADVRFIQEKEAFEQKQRQIEEEMKEQQRQEELKERQRQEELKQRQRIDEQKERQRQEEQKEKLRQKKEKEAAARCVIVEEINLIPSVSESPDDGDRQSSGNEDNIDESIGPKRVKLTKQSVKPIKKVLSPASQQRQDELMNSLNAKKRFTFELPIPKHNISDGKFSIAVPDYTINKNRQSMVGFYNGFNKYKDLKKDIRTVDVKVKHITPDDPSFLIEPLDEDNFDGQKGCTYICKYCPKAFTTCHHLIRHLRSSHLCVHCLGAFVKTSDLYEHIRNDHEGFPCFLCNRISVTLNHARGHMHSVHKIRLPSHIFLLDPMNTNCS